MSQDICARCGINQAVVGSADGGVCLDCILAAAPNPDPLLLIRKSRLEAALREAWHDGKTRLVLGGYKEQVAACAAYIARAMEELSHE